MKRTGATLLRAALSAAVLISPSLSAAQVVAVSASASAGASAAGAAVRASAAPAALPAFSAAPAPLAVLSPALSAPAAPAALAAPAPAAALAARPAAGDGPTPLQEPLRPGERRHGTGPRMRTGDALVSDGPRGRWLVPLSSFEQPVEPVGWRSTRARLDATFDGIAGRAASVADAPAAVSGRGSALAPLAAASVAATPAKAEVPAAAPRRASGVSRALTIAAFAALLLLTPAVALAAAPAAGPVITAAGSVSLLAGIHPLASAAGAVLGAAYGLSAARGQDSVEPSSGDVLASVLRYGVLGGAAVYVLLDLAQMAFVGPTAGGIKSLSSAMATAALGRTAFQGKLADPATTSADRIVGAFPAVAAALGLSLGVIAFAGAPVLSLTTLATGAMAVTGLAAALYAAVFKVGRSPADGPARMGKGFVLQALMSGLALALTNPWLVGPFAAMGAAGFALVLWTIGRELLSLLPSAPKA